MAEVAPQVLTKDPLSCPHSFCFTSACAPVCVHAHVCISFRISDKPSPRTESRANGVGQRGQGGNSGRRLPLTD